jgi:hypothetical protein
VFYFFILKPQLKKTKQAKQFRESLKKGDKIKTRFYDPAYKNAYFDFINRDLHIIFGPIYKSSKTWAEFFDNIYNLPNVCQKVHPWYTRALMEIRSPYQLPEQWIIDINDSIPVIDYERISFSDPKRLPNYIGELNYYIPFPEDIRNFKYL